MGDVSLVSRPAQFPSVVSSATDCEPCVRAYTVLREGTATSPSFEVFSAIQPTVRLGLVADYRQNRAECEACRALVAELDADCAVGGREPPCDDDEVQLGYKQWMGIWQVQLVRKGQRDFVKAALNVVRHGHSRYGPGPQDVRRELRTHEVFSGPIDQSTVSFERVLRWKAHCDANHAGECHAIEDPWRKWDSLDKILLVDVDEECVCPQPGVSAYLALSYVWGTGLEGLPLVANQVNYAALVKAGSLGSSSPLGRRLPRTIRDAMKVTRRLGYRFLWVDRLCILQDDVNHQRIQLAGMAAIYANASITLVAASGDDSHGLPGIESGHSPVRRPFSVVSLPMGVGMLFDSLKALGEPYGPPSDREYRRRGWTLQEERLSNRTLSFSDREARWICQKMRCREILDDETQVDENRRSDLELKLYRRLFDISAYMTLAVDYTARRLKYDSDAVNAFSAVIAAFSRTMQRGMLYGMPELLFEGVLLWQPRRPLRRRKQQASVPPSWSFLGWAGALDMGWWGELFSNRGRSGDDAKYYRSHMHLKSCVNFCKVNAQTGERVEVQSWYATERACPSSRSSDGDGHYVYIRNLTEPLPTDSGSWLPTLEFRTQRCRIQVGDVIPDPRNDASACVDVSLVEEDGSVVGAIRLNAICAADGPGPGTELDLIAISRCSTSETRFTQVLPELRLFHARCPELCVFLGKCQADEQEVPYDFYNVMWVEWDAGVAYRKAVGRVMASYWDACRPEEVQIVLG